VTQAQRRLQFPHLLNARDLGGCPTTDGRVTSWRSLLRADDLAQLTDEGLAALRAYGVSTVLDMRWADEAARYPSRVRQALPGVHYLHLPLLTVSEDEWRLRSGEVSKEDWTCAALKHVRAEIRQIFAAIADAAPGPLLFHCVAGKDRTGLVAALLLALADATPAAIASDYAESGANLREGYLKRYAEADPARILEAIRCPEEGAHNMLSFLEAAGGARRWLSSVGLSQRQLTALRARLRE
jgi:protein tyrosine/serine phosphatase